MKNLPIIGNHQRRKNKAIRFLKSYRFSFLLLIFFFFAAFRADDAFVVFIQQESKYFTTDKLGQIYVVSPKDELIKYHVDGKILFKYYDRKLGEISYLDATNPFQIMVFYQDFQTIVWLDRTLNRISSIDLSNFGFSQLNTVAVSSDNNIWIYDNTTFQLKKMNHQGQIILESVELNNLIDQLNPNFLVENNSRIYLNNPDNGILVFDTFGQYLQTIPIVNLTNFQVIDHQLFYQKETTFYSFHFQTLENQKVNVPFDIQENEKVFKQKNNWFLVKKNEIEIF